MGGGVPGQNGANLKCCDHTDAQTCPDGEGDGFGPFPGCCSPGGAGPRPSRTVTSVYRSNFSCIEYRSHFSVKTLLGTSLPPEGFQSLSSLDGNQARGKLVPPGACDRSRAARLHSDSSAPWMAPTSARKWWGRRKVPLGRPAQASAPQPSQPSTKRSVAASESPGTLPRCIWDDRPGCCSSSIF